MTMAMVGWATNFGTKTWLICGFFCMSRRYLVQSLCTIRTIFAWSHCCSRVKAKIGEGSSQVTLDCHEGSTVEPQ